VGAGSPRPVLLEAYAAVESASEEDDPSSCANISRKVAINSSRETWLFLN